MADVANTKRKQITQPEDWWKAIEEQAEKNNVCLSAWMGKCCLHFVDKKRRSSLSMRGPRGRRWPDSKRN